MQQDVLSMMATKIEFRARLSSGKNFVWHFVREGESISIGDAAHCTWHIRTPKPGAKLDIRFDGQKLILVPDQWVFAGGKTLEKPVVLPNELFLTLGDLELQMGYRPKDQPVSSQGNKANGVPSVVVTPLGGVASGAIGSDSVDENLATIKAKNPSMPYGKQDGARHSSNAIVEKIQRAKAAYEASTSASVSGSSSGAHQAIHPPAHQMDAGATVVHDPGVIRSYAAGLAQKQQLPAITPLPEEGQRGGEGPKSVYNGPTGTALLPRTSGLFALPADVKEAEERRSKTKMTKRQRPKKSRARKIVFACVGFMTIAALAFFVLEQLKKQKAAKAAQARIPKAKVYTEKDLPKVKVRKTAPIFVVQAKGNEDSAALEKVAMDHFAAGRLRKAERLYEALAGRYPKDRRYRVVTRLIKEKLAKRCANKHSASDPLCMVSSQ